LNILFRTAGGSARGKQLGLGHIFRCISLAKKFQKHNIYFLIEDYGKAKKIIKENGFKKISVMERGIKVDKESKIIKNYIKKEKIDIVIIDKFPIKRTVLKNIKKFTKVVVISDLKKIEFDVDLIINGFIGFKNKPFKNRFGTRCLIGPKYQILDKIKSKNYSQKDKKIDILASFGGYDENKIGELFLKIIGKNKHKKIKTKLILGPSTIIFSKRKLKINTQNCKIMRSTKNMLKEMSNCKYGLCSGGLTTYEFASLNIPFGIISQNHHQTITAKEWKKKGTAVNLGLINKNTHKKIEFFLDLVMNKKLKRQKKIICDGLGTKRVVNEILKL
jgi:UDP-2,4-diacetamido-2,4,6-trideoxy-beta-L-altropyranose hydrolase